MADQSYGIRVSPPAADDIVDVCDNLSGYSEAAADRFLDRIEAVYERIEVFPLAYTEVEPGLRRAPLSPFPYVLFYRVRHDAGELDILAVLHMRSSPDGWP